MSVKYLLALFIAAIIGITGCSDSSGPNVIIFFADDLGYGDLSCFGSEHIKTPVLDNIAENGMMLTSFYVGAPHCSQSRAALLTGCYPARALGNFSGVFFPRGSRDGFMDANKGMHPDEVTIAEVFRETGYATACIGKWHLGDVSPMMPNDQGFDYYFGLPYSNDMIPQWLPACPDIPLYENDKVVEYNPDQDYIEKRYADKAIEFIRQNRRNPFFIYYAHSMPHRPLHVSPGFMKERYPGVNTMIEGEDKERRDFIYEYAVEEMDYHIGRIMEELERQGIHDNTLIIFTSDNGSTTNLIYRSCAPLTGGKGSTYEGGFRVPFLMQWPARIKPGQVSSEIVASIDLLPTLSSICGGKTPTDRIIDGMNMADFFFGKTDNSGRDHLFYYNSNKMVAVRKNYWKYHTGNGLLFDLKEDTGETKNLADEYPQITRELKETGLSFDSSLVRRPIGVFDKN